MKTVEVVCDICSGVIASCVVEDLDAPVHGSLFLPIQAGWPKPFVSDFDWEFLRCPRCRFRPFIETDEITIKNEWNQRVKFKIGKTEKFAQAYRPKSKTKRPFKCICGKTYTTKPSLQRHMRDSGCAGPEAMRPRPRNKNSLLSAIENAGDVVLGKEFICDTCGKDFSNAHGLKVHVGTKHSIPLYPPEGSSGTG